MWNALTGAWDVMVLRIVSRTACLRTTLVVSHSSWSVVLDIRWVLLALSDPFCCLQACSQSDGKAQRGRKYSLMALRNSPGRFVKIVGYAITSINLGLSKNLDSLQESRVVF